MVNKKGFAPILFILIVLAISSAIIFFVVRNHQKAKAAGAIYPTPGGLLNINPWYSSNNGSVTLTATDVHGANGAAVDSVRYYLLNPKLATGNNWGNPDWCSNGTPCTQSTTGGYITYDISESSNPGNNYQVIWDRNTHSSGSTAYSRALTPTNIPPGDYKIVLRVQDVNGNVQGSASDRSYTITDGTLPSPTPKPDLGLRFSTTYFGLKLAAGGDGLKAFDLTSTGATRYELYTPTNSLGILFSPSSGSIIPGQTIPIYVKASVGQPFGIYTGTVYASSSTVNAQTPTGVTDSVTVEPGSYDTDKDGFTNDIENKIGTDPNYSCTTPSGVGAWPPDVDNDKVVSTLDLSKISSVFGAKVGDVKYNKRYDLDADGAITILDLSRASKYNGKTCS